MSGFWDSYSGAGYDGTEDGGIGDVGASSTPSTGAATTDAGSGWWSGTLQSLTALGTGYLAKSLDIDLYRKAQAATPYPGLGTTQGQIILGGAGVPRSGGLTGQQQPTLLNLNALMPYLLIAGVVFFIARKG